MHSSRSSQKRWNMVQIAQSILVNAFFSKCHAGWRGTIISLSTSLWNASIRKVAKSIRLENLVFAKYSSTLNTFFAFSLGQNTLIITVFWSKDIFEIVVFFYSFYLCRKCSSRDKEMNFWSLKREIASFENLLSFTTVLCYVSQIE